MLIGLLSIALSRADKDNLMLGLQEGIRQFRDQFRDPRWRFSQTISPQEMAEQSLPQTLFSAVGWAFILIGILTLFVR